MRIVGIVVSSILFVSLCFAQGKIATSKEPKVISFGHLVSGNSQVLDKGDVTIGTLVVGYGISDQWTTVVSPFAFTSYNMLNWINRFSWKTGDYSRFSLDQAYFKTFSRGRNSNLDTYTEEEIQANPELWQGFDMEAHVLKSTFSQEFSESYRGNVTLSYYNYTNDRRPFSLRMDPQNNDNYASNLTTLHEIRLSERWKINPEIGIWGMNYSYPYVHSGLTFQNRGEKYLIEFGMSATYSPGLPKEKIKAWGPEYTNQISFHPELQIQLFL